MFITKKQWNSIEECDCGGSVFKYHDTTKNIMVAKCGLFRKIIEINPKTKKKSWVSSKKQPCNFNYIYPGQRPIYKIDEIKIDHIAEINKKVNCIAENDNNTLEERLKALFSFLFVSRYTSTIQQIDDIVKNNLKKEPRKTFYYPSTTAFMRVSHVEEYIDYRNRIFSEKIIDRSGNYSEPNNLTYSNIKIKKEQATVLFSHPLLPKICLPIKYQEPIAPGTPDITTKNMCQFIEPDPILDSKNDNESDQDESDHSENSDNSDNSDSGESFYGSDDENDSPESDNDNGSFYGSDKD